MSDATPPELSELIDPDFNLTPQTKDVSAGYFFEFKDKLAGALMEAHQSDPNVPLAVGHSGLICRNQAAVQALTGEDVPPQTRPDPGPEPAADADNAVALHKRWQAVVLRQREFDGMVKKVKSLVVLVFPAQVKRLKNKMGKIDPNLNICDLLDRLQRAIVTPTKAAAEVSKLRNEMRTLKFDHHNGGDEYFAKINNLVVMSQRLGVTVGWNEVLSEMKNAMRVAPKFQTNTMLAVLNACEAAEQRHIAALPAGGRAAAAANYEEVASRWIEEVIPKVKELVPDAHPRERANLAAEQAAFADDIEVLRDQVEHLTATQVTREDIHRALLAVQPRVITPPPSPIRPYPPRPDPYPDVPDKCFAARPAAPQISKRYNWWCWTHGVNTNHGHKIGGNGYIPCENAKAGHKTEATIDNPMSGNTRRDDKAGKWWVANADGSNPHVASAPPA